MIEVTNLTKKYGNFSAVKDVSFLIGKGEIVGFLGPNGAGKTTIMKVLTGFHYPSAGDVFINNFDVKNDPIKVKQSIGYLPENAPVYSDLTVFEYLEFIAESRGITPKEKKINRIKKVVEECGLKKVLHRKIETLSKGFKQRAGFAQAIIHEPEILILDEPTTGLDPNQIIEIREMIKRIGQKKTIILCTHILQEVEAVCSRVLILNDGKIRATGTAAEIRTELEGDTILSISVKGDNIDNAAESVARLDKIKKVKKIKTEGQNRIILKLSMDGSEDACEAVFDWAVKENYKLTEMKLQQLSLEDIFIKLTTEGEQK